MPIPSNRETGFRQLFDELKACVLIPTYNNAGTLESVLMGVQQFTENILVVNDGSTDDTHLILNKVRPAHVVTHKKNYGKGSALRSGFKLALEKGFDFAITIDSDGQHFPSDIPAFLSLLQEEKHAVIIGARNMSQEGIPSKSSFGHKFSNFWFKIETSIAVEDTQSGFRAYPIKDISQINFYTTGFEFEIEVLVRAAWKGIRIATVPVSVYYAPENRVTHFRPFQDFLRVSLLNTVLVIIALVYYHPRRFLNTILDKEKRRKFLNENLLDTSCSDARKAVSIGFGVFMGIIPIWGFQLAVAILIAFLFRLNKALVIIAANISIPPMIPVILFASYRTGSLFIHQGSVRDAVPVNYTLDSLKYNGLQYLYGSIGLAISAGIVLGLCSYIAMKIFRKRIA